MIESTLPRAGITQLVECQLPKLNVAGSSPVARSISDICSKDSHYGPLWTR